MTTIRQWNYDPRPSGKTAVAFQVGKLVFYFSYDTLIAFKEEGWNPVIRINEWGRTTGRHLNAIEQQISKDGRERLPSEIFYTRLEQILSKYGISEVI